VKYNLWFLPHLCPQALYGVCDPVTQLPWNSNAHRLLGREGTGKCGYKMLPRELRVFFQGYLDKTGVENLDRALHPKTRLDGGQ
jgi:hypothetical protein